MASIPLRDIPHHHAARLGRDTIAVRVGEEALSWGDLDERSTRRAYALSALGVGANDLVTIALKNELLFFEWTFAIWKLGAVPHAASWRSSAAELAAMLELARPAAVIASEADRLSSVGAISADWGLSETGKGPLPDIVSSHWKAMSSGGSTGRPKIIVDHKPALYDSQSTYLGVADGETVLNPGPLYHNAPFSMAHNALFKGNPLINLAKFDAEETLRLIDCHGVASINFVPTMMLRIWRLPDDVKARYDLSSLRNIWHMAAPMPRWLKHAWIDWIGAEKINEAYAGTESVGATTINGTEWVLHEGSVGRPKNCSVRILDEAGAELPSGSIGEVWLKPNNPQKAYHYIGAQQPSGTSDYESLGDHGWVDADGYLYLADRRTDLVISGGSNIYPAEVENAIMEHPAVETAVVIGLPDEDLGASVHAIVKLNDGSSSRPGADDLIAFLRSRLVSYKLPRSFEFTQFQLRDEAGKVRRSQLRQERMNENLVGPLTGKSV
ncbi:AMP-binding protein [Sphingobium sp. CR2-8]|uniref:AMP-binding protein n=1 Tax=Sphingobium sp. CR2-8 TaxID=1306534 RepID=UPI002DBE3D2E|nr:AMP-binding protein [Sphingobium sp. CR2-8]MEC3909526.1 AMP-binding protein [Sphingobium sp. CR2-8]